MDYIKMAILTASLTVVNLAHAAVESVVGKVEYIRSHDVVDGVWKPPLFWFSVEGVSSAGGCQQWNGRVLFVGETDQGLSMLLASQMSERLVEISYDPSVIKNGFCKALNITTGNPPPSI